MQTATIIRFPQLPRFTALRTWRAGVGPGDVVAVLYAMPHDHANHRDQDQHADQQHCGQREDVGNEL